MTEIHLVRKTQITKAVKDLLTVKNADNYEQMQKIILERYKISDTETNALLIEISDQKVDALHQKLVNSGLPISRKLVNVLYRTSLSVSTSDSKPFLELFRRPS